MGPYGYSWQAPRTTDDNPIVPPLNVYVEHYEDGEFVPEFKNYKYIGNKMTSMFIVHVFHGVFYAVISVYVFMYRIISLICGPKQL